MGRGGAGRGGAIGAVIGRIIGIGMEQLVV